MAAKVLKTSKVHLMNFCTKTKLRSSKPPLHKYLTDVAQSSAIGYGLRHNLSRPYGIVPPDYIRLMYSVLRFQRRTTHNLSRSYGIIRIYTIPSVKIFRAERYKSGGTLPVILKNLSPKKKNLYNYQILVTLNL